MRIAILINSQDEYFVNMLKKQTYDQIECITNTNNLDEESFYNNSIGRINKSKIDIVSFLTGREEYLSVDTLLKIVNTFKESTKIKAVYTDVLYKYRNNLVGYNPPYYQGCSERFINCPFFYNIKKINILYNTNFIKTFHNIEISNFCMHIASPEIVYVR